MPGTELVSLYAQIISSLQPPCEVYYYYYYFYYFTKVEMKVQRS